MNHKITQIHEAALKIAERFHKSESDLLDILQEIDENKVFVHLGFSSLFDYAIKALKLSEANASNFITVARKSKIVPELKEAIRSQEITISKARKITPVLTKENSSHWLELAKSLPRPALEKEVARVAPQTLIYDKAKYITENRLELRISVSEEVMSELKRAQDLISQKSKKAATFEETLSQLLQEYLWKNDPVKRAARNIHKKDSIGRTTSDLKDQNSEQNNAEASVHGHIEYQDTKKISAIKNRKIKTTKRISLRPNLPANLKHQINLRDNGQCTHTNNENERCEQKRWLEVHHVLPVSQGGNNDLTNLTTLCSNHHRHLHS